MKYILTGIAFPALLILTRKNGGAPPAGAIQSTVMLAFVLKAENNAVSGMTLLTSVLTVAKLTGVFRVTARRAPERTAFCVTCETKNTNPQSTAAPTKTISRGMIKVTSTRV